MSQESHQARSVTAGRCPMHRVVLVVIIEARRTGALRFATSASTHSTSSQGR